MSNEMFTVNKYVAASATQNVPAITTEFAENYESEFFGANGVKKRRKKSRRGRRKLGGGGLKRFMQAQRDRRDLRAKSKAEERTTQAKAQLESAKAMSKSVAGDVAIAKALKSSEPKKGMSTGVKIAIGVGALLVVGVVGYFLVKGKK